MILLKFCFLFCINQLVSCEEHLLEDLADNDEQDEPDITDFDEDYHYKDYPDEETRRGYNNDDQEVHKGFYNEEEFKDVFFYDESFQHDETTKVSQENEFQDGNREDVSSDGNDEFLIDDMILTKDQMDDLFLASDRRNGISEKDHLWPNGTVPVSISDSFNKAQKAKILSALNLISSKTCIKFINLPSNFTELSYVRVAAGDGCSSFVGYREGEVVQMSLNVEGCLDQGRILHEFLHALGFFHMHTTVNRDEHVTILWENIIQDYFENFESFSDRVSMLDTPYDFESVTHYSSKAFSKNGHNTIVAKVPSAGKAMGQRTHLSKGDIIRINRLYECQ